MAGFARRTPTATTRILRKDSGRCAGEPGARGCPPGPFLNFGLHCFLCKPGVYPPTNATQSEAPLFFAFPMWFENTPQLGSLLYWNKIPDDVLYQPGRNDPPPRQAQLLPP